MMMYSTMIWMIMIWRFVNCSRIASISSKTQKYFPLILPTIVQDYCRWKHKKAFILLLMRLMNWTIHIFCRVVLKNTDTVSVYFTYLHLYLSLSLYSFADMHGQFRAFLQDDGDQFEDESKVFNKN